jgi:TP901 family phage tail tape measure protein
VRDRSIFVRLGAVASGLKQGFKESEAAAKQAAAAIEQAGKKADAAVEKSAAKLPVLARAGTAIGTQWTKAKGHVSALTTEVAANREQFERLSTTATIAGGLMVAGVAVATKKFADFDQAMSNVKATGSDAANSLGALRETALRLGADTVFSASEAAEGIENMLKAGVSARDVVGGGLKGALDLAAAGQLSVAESAEIAATALTQFGLSGAQVGHVADLLAAGAGKAQGEVSDLANALKYVGPVAAGMGVSIEEATGALAAFASQGIISDQAGTSLRGVLASLTSPSAAARKEIERLKISLYDGNGKFKGLSNMAGELQKAYAGVSDKAKDASLGILFGNQQVTAARVLFDQGAKGIESWVNQVDDAGYAARAAATRLDNLAGDVEQLSGAIDSALIQSGSGMNEMLRGLTQSATGAVNAIGELPAPLLGAGARMTALTGVGLLATGMLLKGVTAFADYRDALRKISTEAPNASKAISGVTKGAKALGIALATLQIASVFGSMQQAAIDKTASSLADMAEAAASAGTGGGLTKLNSELGEVQSSILGFRTGAPLVRSTGEALRDLAAGGEGLSGFGNGLARTMHGLVGLKTNFDQLAEQVSKVDQALATMDSDQAVTSFQQISRAAREQGVSNEALLAQFPQYKARLQALAQQYGVTNLAAEDYVGWMRGQVPGAIQLAMQSNGELTDSLSDTDRALVGATESAEAFAASMFKVAQDALKMSGTKIGFEAAIDDADETIRKNRKKQQKVGSTSLDYEVNRQNKRALDELATSAHAYVQTLVAQGHSSDEAAEATKRARVAYVNAAIAAGYGGTKAREMADEMGLIPADVKANIESTLDNKGGREWKVWKPGDKYPKIRPKLTQSTFDVTLKTVWRINGGPQFSTADGAIYSALAGAGIRKSFADGGLDGTIGAQQPQIQPNRGPRGIQWAETGAGPWEAFVSGHPGKKTRSRTITSEVADRLGGDVIWRNADGGIRDYRVARQVLYGQPAAGPTINVSAVTHYPIPEPSSATVNRGLQAAAALGFGGGS